MIKSTDYTLEVLNRENISGYELLMEPDYRQYLDKFDPENDVAVGACVRNKLLGLAFSKVIRNKDGKISGWILSVQVDPDNRNIGIGTTLLKRTEKELKSKGCSKLFLTFIGNGLESAAFKRILEKREWAQPKIRGYQYLTTTKLFFSKVEWVNAFDNFPYKSSIFLWEDLTREEKSRLKKEESERESWSGESSPFNYEDIYEPNTSLGIRRDGEIAGWLITSLHKPDTLFYETFFIKEKYRSLGLSASLLRESARRQKKLRIPNSIWYVHGPNKKAKKLTKKMLGPCVIKEEELYDSYKNLT